MIGGTVLMVHPEDVNLADAKAMAAQQNATVMGSIYVPRGQMFLMRHGEYVNFD